MKLTSTKYAKADGVKMLVYGASGVGKTALCATAPDPVIISAERGLLSISHLDIPVYEVESASDLSKVYKEVKKSDFKTICLDSMSEIAESVLCEYKELVSDGRQSYGMLNDKISSLLREFRDLPGKNVVMTAKELREEAKGGVLVSRPSMPGKTLTNGVAYYFDLVLFMKATKTERLLHTQSSPLYDAKDRSGKLSATEQPNLTEIFNKVMNNGTI